MSKTLLQKYDEAEKEFKRTYKKLADDADGISIDDQAKLNVIQKKIDAIFKELNGAPKDPVDAMIEEAIGDPEERIKALAKWKVPRYTEKYKDDTPETQFLADMESGTKKAQEYIDYINRSLEYAEKFGDLSALDRVGSAATGLKKITGKLSSGLGKAGKTFSKAKELAEWIVAFDQFADDSSSMNPRDRKSVERWAGSMKQFWNASAPFAEWLHSKAVAGALAGSEVAGMAGATLAIVGAQIYVGIELLEAGIKNVNAYLDRYDKIMAEIERGGAAEQRDPPPNYPGDWKSRDEEARDAAARENYELRSRIRSAREREIQQATERFETDLFPKVYLARRSDIRSKILAAMRRAGSESYNVGDTKASDWWECLMTDDAAMDRTAPSGDPDSLTGGPFFDKQAGIYIHPTKAKVSMEEALQEIVEFQGLSKPCPYFKDLYDTALKMHLAKAVSISP